jgi:hypothetical protein
MRVPPLAQLVTSSVGRVFEALSIAAVVAGRETSFEAPSDDKLSSPDREALCSEIVLFQSPEGRSREDASRPETSTPTGERTGVTSNWRPALARLLPNGLTRRRDRAIRPKWKR